MERPGVQKLAKLKLMNASQPPSVTMENARQRLVAGRMAREYEIDGGGRPADGDHPHPSPVDKLRTARRRND